MVAGYNYEAGEGATFRKFCLTRTQQLLDRDGDPNSLVFTLFDVSAGTIEQNQAHTPKARRWVVIDDKFKPVTVANYSNFKRGRDGNAFDTAPDGVMSIIDLYAFVSARGAGEWKASVIELSIFSHSHLRGPILVNSFDASGSPQKRDPNDKDARSDKDFRSANMSDAQRAAFRAAFASGAITWTWGCEADHSMNVVMQTFLAKSKKRSYAMIKDTDRFSLEFSQGNSAQSQQTFIDVTHYILPGGAILRNRYKVSPTFGFLKRQFSKVMAGSYSAALAIGSGADSYGALPATSTDYDVANSSRYLLLRVSTQKPPYGTNFSATLRFYREALKVRLDPEGRHYGLYPGVGK